MIVIWIAAIVVFGIVEAVTVGRKNSFQTVRLSRFVAALLLILLMQ